MGIVALAELFSGLLGHRVFAINFPEYTEGTFIKIEITSGVRELGGVFDFNVQFMIKDKHPAKAELLTLEIISKLDDLTDVEFNKNKYQLILCKASSPQPYFMGVTETGEQVFSADFRLLTTEI